MLLNLGSGPHYAGGWVNVDWKAPYPADPVLDLRRPLPWLPGTVQAVYAGHFLEHLTPDEAADLLFRLGVVMAPGGQIMVVGPDVDRADQHFEQNLINEETRQACFKSEPGAPVHWPGSNHEWDCTGPAVVRLLAEAGWEGVHEIPVEQVPAHWPITARPTWQCAATATAPK